MLLPNRSTSKRAGLLRRLHRWAVGGALALGAAGCANFWDDLTATSPEGGWKASLALKYERIFHRPEPMEVLAHPERYDDTTRARAIRALKEPLAHRGSQQEQDLLVNLLTAAVKAEKQTVVRLAAVEKLGEFRDPRAGKALLDAFFAPANFADRTAIVRIATIDALAKHRDPAAIETLTMAAARDPSIDVRIAATRALGQFDHHQAAAALVTILKEEKDVALRYQARLSVEALTGKEMPAQPEAWDQYFQQHLRTDPRVARDPAGTPPVQPVGYPPPAN